MPEEIKKSYNPFKMWGSWIGGILFSFAATMYGNLWETGSLFKSSGGVDIYSLIFGFVFGFIVGWGIHSLFRKLSK